ncbi:AAA family ATPase [Pararhodobacter sp.]
MPPSPNPDAGAKGLETRYARTAFAVPPWPEIRGTDADRRNDFGAARVDHDRLCAFYPRFGYQVVTIPRLPIDRRATWLLRQMGTQT